MLIKLISNTLHLLVMYLIVAQYSLQRKMAHWWLQALSLLVLKLAIDPKIIIDPEAIYTALAPYMTMDHATFITKASKKTDPYEEVTTHLTKEQADTIDAFHLTGVSIYKDNWRFYPGGSKTHTLGFLAYKDNNKVGQYGLERYYNDVLSKPVDESYVNFFAEVFSNLRDTVSNTTGFRVILSLLLNLLHSICSKENCLQR